MNNRAKVDELLKHISTAGSVYTDYAIPLANVIADLEAKREEMRDIAARSAARVLVLKRELLATLDVGGARVMEMLRSAMDSADLPSDYRPHMAGFFSNEWNKGLATKSSTAAERIAYLEKHLAAMDVAARKAESVLMDIGYSISENGEWSSPSSEVRDTPVAQAIEADAVAFEAHIGGKPSRIKSDAYPWGWRYTLDVYQQEFKEWCNRPKVAEPAEGLKLVWTEPTAPNSEIPYHHVVAQTPFGRILITWKDWKEDRGFAIDEHPLKDTVYWTGHELEHTKATAEELFFAAVNEAKTASVAPTKAPPELTVWYGSMPESNGKSNFTAILHRKDKEGLATFEGFTIARSEYPDRVRYDADSMCYLIGELAEEPCILNYDGDKHSGYVSPKSVDAKSEKLAVAYDVLALVIATTTDPETAKLAADNIRQFAPDAGPSLSYQQRVLPWMMACFGSEISSDFKERNHRFLEEALELVQTGDCTAEEAHQLVDYVFGRPVGEKSQEVGGVLVTLAAWCLAHSLDMHACGEIELTRIWTKVEQIRTKQAAKPKFFAQ